MSGKQGGRKWKRPGKEGGQDKTEHVLQAVLIADDFQDRFKPLTLDTPRCLLPLVGVPLIEYSLHFLAMNGVQEVFIYCGAHGEAIESYVETSPVWGPEHRASEFQSLEFIRVLDARSIGDFLRDLDKRGLIEGDFMLVHGDLVANVEMDPILAKHRARREANRDVCMTMVLRSVTGTDPKLDASGPRPLFVVHVEDGRCLQYDELDPLTKKDFYLDKYCLSFGTIDQRADLIDCGIDICTPDVLALWSESFDYMLPRKNFLHGVLKDWELNGKMITAEIVDNQYAARASTLRMYDLISQDVLGGRTVPFIPTSNLMSDSRYERVKEAVLEDGVSTAADCSLLRCAVGSGTMVDAASVVTKSVIGRGCKIGANVRIENSYIWDHVTIASGSTVRNSLLATSVSVGRNCHVPRGSILSWGTCLDDQVTLRAASQTDEDTRPTVVSIKAHDGATVETDRTVVGAAGKGSIFQENVDSDDENEGPDAVAVSRALMYSLVGLELSLDDFPGDESDDETDSPIEATQVRNRLSSFASEASTACDGFHHDAMHGLIDALRSDGLDDFDSAKMEFMGLRLSHNASDSSMRKAVAMAFARRAAELLGPAHGGLEPKKAAERALTCKKGSVKFIEEAALKNAEKDKQAEFVLTMQKALGRAARAEAEAEDGLKPGRAGTLLAALLQQLYMHDVLEEEGVFAWWGDARSLEGDAMSKIRDKCRVFVEWLEDAEEEDSDIHDDA